MKKPYEWEYDSRKLSNYQKKRKNYSKKENSPMEDTQNDDPNDRTLQNHPTTQKWKKFPRTQMKIQMITQENLLYNQKEITKPQEETEAETTDPLQE